MLLPFSSNDVVNVPMAKRNNKDIKRPLNSRNKSNIQGKILRIKGRQRKMFSV
jgi:hypothetical protein